MTCCWPKKYIWTAAVFLHLSVSAIAQMKPDSVYYDNGSLKAIGFTKDAIQDSAWIYYDQSGRIQRKGIYKSGLKTGKWEYFLPNGILSHNIWFRNDTLLKKLNYLHKNGSFEVLIPNKNN